MMVLDPSIASGPITVRTWAWLMGATEQGTTITSPGRPPTNPHTGVTYPGTGYWLEGDPPEAFGGVDGYSATIMQNYLNCGNAGIICANPFPPAAWEHAPKDK